MARTVLRCVAETVYNNGESDWRVRATAEEERPKTSQSIVGVI